MSQQTENDPGALLLSLRAKLQQFADDLTPEEEAQISSMQHGTDAGDLSPSLRAKAQQTADGLTAEERMRLRAVVGRAGAAAGGKEDTVGQMIKEPRVEPMPENLGGGGGKLPNYIGSKIWEQSGIPDAWRAINSFF